MGGHIRGVVTGWRPEKFLGYTWNVFQPGEDGFALADLLSGIRAGAADGGTTLTLTHRPIPERDAEPDHDGLAHHARPDRGGPERRISHTPDLLPNNAALYGVDLNNLKR